MKKLKEHLFIILISLYIALLTALAGRLLITTLKKPALSYQSPVPSLAVDQLNRITDQLKQREKLSSQTPLDLNQIQFGNLEPFKP